jgi:hypothetical protein
MLILVIALLSVGCGSSGGGGGGAVIVPTASTGTTSVSGTTGSSSSGSGGSSAMSVGAFSMEVSGNVTPTTDTIAILTVDSNGDLKLTSTDAKYSTPVLSDGSFSFDSVTVSDTGETMAQLMVKKDGFAPVIKMLYLTKDTPVSVLAKVGDIPVLTVVNKLPDPNKRTNTYLKFGVNKTDSGVSAYSKFMSLSQLKAEANLDLNESTLSESTIPLSAFDANVTTVTADLQAFDSTNEKDIAMFPGAFTGHGKPSASSSATSSDTENALESAAFDMIKLTDQNGKDIVLNSSSSSSKLLAPSASTCGGMFWRRHVNAAQDAIIMAWRDEDSSTAGHQVPIWSNDNSTNSWEYVGLATYTHSSRTFEMCVDKKWQGYLNCDSEINVGGAPKKLCVYTVDQFGALIGGFEISAKHGNSFTKRYVNPFGYTSLPLSTDANSANEVNTNWEFYYNGIITGWNDIKIRDNVTSGSLSGCDYDLNISVSNPYIATIKVKAYSKDDNTTALLYKGIRLVNRTYANQYDKYANTGSTGEAVFKVKSGVDYTAKYQGGTATARVNNVVREPETADNGSIVSVKVQDVNSAPSCSLYVYNSRIKTSATDVSFNIMGSDSNGDTLTLSSLTLNGVPLREFVDYIPSYTSNISGSYYMSATLDLTSTTISSITPTLAEGTFTLIATLSDGKLTATSNDSFRVAANTPPVITSISFIDSNNSRTYYQNNAIAVGDYYVRAAAHDRDGDSLTRVIKVDGNTVPFRTPVRLNVGDHNVSVTVTEEYTTERLSATRDFSIYIGNHAPTLSNVVAIPNRVDIKRHETFKIHAFANDIDGDALTLSATDENGTQYSFTKSLAGNEYVSQPITINVVKKDNPFRVIANDTDKNSTEVTISVESYASNLPPVFDKELSDRTVEVNTQQTFECNATDPEGTAIAYSWKIDNVTQSETSTILTYTFATTGAHYVSCSATDSDATDPKSSTSTATILVTNPAVAGTLTIHTGYEGIKVTRHANSNFALLEEKHTDANGNAVFSVTGDRTTFAITTWSGMEMHKNLLMEIVKEDMDRDARNVCDMNNSAASECRTIDWCAMYDTDTIATWVWKLSADNDNDNNISASSVDTDHSGLIDSSELYTALVANIDKNNDGKISFAEMEIKGRNVKVEVFANVPVREYYIGFSPISNQNDYPETGGYWECMEAQTFDTNLTLHYTGSRTNGVKNGSLGGSGYGWMYGEPNKNGDLNMSVRYSHKDTDGTYSFLVKERDSNVTQYNYMLLSGKTKTQLDAGITLDISSFTPSDKNVTLRDVNATTFSISTLYKGLYFYASDNYLNSGHSAMFYTNPAFTYSYAGYNYSTPNVNKRHFGYYTDTTLQSSYDPNDYPFLDVDITYSATNTWSLSGAEMSKLNSVSYSLEENVYDANTSENSKLDVCINWTIAPTSMPSVDILSVMPTDVKADVAYIVSLATGYRQGLKLQEVKGLNETQFIDLIAGSSHTEIQIDGLLGDKGIRTTESVKSVNLPTSTSTKASKASIFTIDYDTSHIFSK